MLEEEFDELLDRALKSYSAMDPPVGLEQRVLSRVQGSRHSARSFLWVWAALAVIAAVVLVGVRPKQHGPEAVQVQAVVQQTPAVPALARVKVAEHRHRAVRHKPSPPRLTEEEQLLVQFVDADPAAAADVFKSLHEVANRDVAVRPITLPPIQLAELR